MNLGIIIFYKLSFMPNVLCNQNWNSSFFLKKLHAYKLPYIHIKCKMKEQMPHVINYGCWTPWVQKNV
jgi:hypothetical protein